MNETNLVIQKIKDYEKRQSELKLDNGELRELIAAFEKAEEKSAVLNSIIASSDDAIISKNLHSIITSWNSAAERIFGYTAAQMVGSSILKIIPPDLHDEEPKILAQLKKGIRIDHFETQRLRSDGSLVDVSLTISPIYGINGEVIGLSKIARDMTHHRTAEIDGRRLMAIIESSDDAIISKDLNSTVTSWNASAVRLFGYTPEEMIGESIVKLIPQERHDEEPKILEQLRRGIRVDHFETERLRKDGTLINVSLTISPIKDRYGKVVGLSKIARDITDKKQMEKKKDEFVSFVSHELKTPLTSVKSYLQIAIKKTNDLAFLTNALERAAIQVKKMENMIGDFLNISRFEHGHLKINAAVFDIVDLLDECIADARISSQRHTLSYQGVSTCNVTADREKIAIVLTNLISNGQKYSPNGGDIVISCTILKGKAKIRVTDNGLGISDAHKMDLFKKFHRVETKETEQIAGFGIGLYLASTIIELHGSKIDLESAPGKGSTFSFELPQAEV